MLIRPAYPDEISRARLLLAGHPVPPHAVFLLGVKETPVERILAAVPWWQASTPGQHQTEVLRFQLHSPRSLSVTHLSAIIQDLENIACANQLEAIHFDSPISSSHPFYPHLTENGFEIFQTDRYFSVSGDAAKSRSQRIFKHVEARIPKDWNIESIRGHDPEKVFAIVSAHNLMSAHQFQHYWNTGINERFEENYSCLLTCGGEILGVVLLSQRGESELHNHVEAVNPEYNTLSPLISATLRNASALRCAVGFPETYTFRADSRKHQQTANTALRQGGIEHPPRHFLKKRIS